MTDTTDDDAKQGAARDATVIVTAFRQDPSGDWIAELACGHARHVRHRPPWQVAPWVMTEAGRTAKVGTALECRLCATVGPHDDGGND